MFNREKLKKNIEVRGKFFLRRLKYEWKKWDEQTFERSKEKKVKIDWDSLEGSKKIADIAHNVQDPDLIRVFFRYGSIIMIASALFSERGLVDKVKEFADNPDEIKGILILSMMTFFPLSIVQSMNIKARKIANDLFPELLEIREIQENFKKYKYFYLNENLEIVFTNIKPPALIRYHHRHETSDTWGKDYRPGMIERVLDGVGAAGWSMYIRAFYPYILNPIQLNFREYDSAAKRLNLKMGDNVLVLGAGPVPHHTRWKKKIGPEGKIVALDYDRKVLSDSKRIEDTIDRAHEFVRGVKRTTSDYVHGDANDLSKFASNSFDAIAAIRCYTYSIDEAVRVLKPGGKFVIYQGQQDISIPENFPHKIESFWNGLIITKKSV